MSSSTITRVAIKGLFGLYDYVLPEDRNLQNVAILYGDNGTGKTTLLKLVFHLLSPANNRGHRTYLYNTDFQSLDVHLASGHKISATCRNIELIKHLKLEIFQEENLIALWDYYGPEIDKYVRNEPGFDIEIDSEGRPSLKPREKSANSTLVNIGNSAYLQTLEKIAPTMYMLNDERRIESDTIDPRRLVSKSDEKPRDSAATVAKEAALTDALGAAATWIARNGLMVANQGSMNVHTAYLTMLKQLNPKLNIQDPLDATRSPEQLISKIDEIQSKINLQSAYELTSKLSLDEFKKALKRPNAKMAANLLAPYIGSLESRSNAIEPVHTVVDDFITRLNDLLRDKVMSYTVGKGFRITNFNGKELTVKNLSSGEQHLLLLFSYLLISRDRNSVFIIDDPEISLNIKWQRRLISSLMDIIADVSVQLILATHSIELLSQHKSCVIKLKQKGEISNASLD